MGHFIARQADRVMRLAGVVACVAALGGCGGVELQGKVFDYMGVSGDRQQPDVRMSERPPLLIPPNTKALPQPGTGSTATARADWPDDPEKVRTRVANEQKAKQAKIEAAADPTNPYAGKPNLFDKLLSRDKTVEEPISDVPEPDASDRVPDGNTAVAQKPYEAPKAITPHQTQEPLPTRPVQPATPGSYGGMSNPEGNNANW
ncbi:hypothetical protein [Methyloceanibacter superfactus]|nr:hypothetical protein [Methyloceanibacter superfactus]